MLVIEVNDPRPANSTGRCYIGESDKMTTDLQKAYVFVEGNDKDIPWPSEQVEIESVILLLEPHKPTKIKVENCEVCAAVKFKTANCPACSIDK